MDIIMDVFIDGAWYKNAKVCFEQSKGYLSFQYAVSAEGVDLEANSEEIEQIEASYICTLATE